MNKTKKIISMILVLIMAVLICACGAKKDTLQEYLDQNGLTQEQLNQAISATAQPTATPTAKPAASIKPAPVVTSAPKSTASPAPTIIIDNTLRVTKHPSGESLTEGGNATFISYGTGYQYIVWRLVSPDGGTVYYMNQAPFAFDGLSVAGDGTSTLILCNIPLSMNGWGVEAVFSANNQSVTSSRAYLSVSKAQRAQLWASPSSGYFQYVDEPVYLYATPGDQIYWQLTCTNNAGYNQSGYVTSGEAIYIPSIGSERYDCYLYAYVVSDPSNAISCAYVMDNIPPFGDLDDVPAMTDSMWNAIITGTYDPDTNYLDDLVIPEGWVPPQN